MFTPNKARVKLKKIKEQAKKVKNKRQNIKEIFVFGRCEWVLKLVPLAACLCRTKKYRTCPFAGKCSFTRSKSESLSNGKFSLLFVWSGGKEGRHFFAFPQVLKFEAVFYLDI